MSLIDKLTGRAKQAAGDVTGDRSLRREGRREEDKGEKKEELNSAEDRVEDKAQEVGRLERDSLRSGCARQPAGHISFYARGRRLSPDRRLRPDRGLSRRGPRVAVRLGRLVLPPAI